MFKANWFIKMSSAYSIALSGKYSFDYSHIFLTFDIIFTLSLFVTETANKSKKRQVIDQSQEWTGILCRFLRDL